MTGYPPPSPLFIGPPSKYSQGYNKPILRIVIHSAVYPPVRGAARRIAQYFKSPQARGSAQYCVDPWEVIQSAWDSMICWHAPPNPQTLGIEMCDIPDNQPKSRLKRWRWAGLAHRATLRRTARLTAELCLAYDIPIRFLGVAELKRKGPRAATGITTHHRTSLAFRQSTHWDPGAWPRVRFMYLVRKLAPLLLEKHETGSSQGLEKFDRQTQALLRKLENS